MRIYYTKDFFTVFLPGTQNSFENAKITRVDLQG